MSIPITGVTVDCQLLTAARVVGVAVLGMAVVALEAWLRMPVGPLLEVALQEAPDRVATWVRKFSF